MNATDASEASAATDAASAPAAPLAVRDRIIAAALQVLHERGINALTQTSVAKLAGVRQSHLTYYFPTRNDLLKQAVVSGTASILEVLESPAASGESLEQFHEAMIREVAHRRVPRMMAALVVASEEDRSLKPWLEQFQADMREHLKRALAARGIRPAQADLELFQATVVGALHLDLASGSEVSRRRTHALLRQALEQLATRADAADAPADGDRRRTDPPARV